MKRVNLKDWVDVYPDEKIHLPDGEIDVISDHVVAVFCDNVLVGVGHQVARTVSGGPHTVRAVPIGKWPKAKSGQIEWPECVIQMRVTDYPVFDRGERQRGEVFTNPERMLRLDGNVAAIRLEARKAKQAMAAQMRVLRSEQAKLERLVALGRPAQELVAEPEVSSASEGPDEEV